jgi:hypothetical protein
MPHGSPQPGLLEKASPSRSSPQPYFRTHAPLRPGLCPYPSPQAGPKSFPRVALDLATTVERIQQNFCIADPSLPDCPIGERREGRRPCALRASSRRRAPSRRHSGVSSCAE